MIDPLTGNLHWAVPDNHSINVTLFKDPRTHELEDKDWSFLIEDVGFCNLLCNSFVTTTIMFVGLTSRQKKVACFN
jgi:hypothetical protein